MPSLKFVWSVILTALFVHTALWFYFKSDFAFFSAMISLAITSGFFALYEGIEEIAKKYLAKK